MSIYLAERVRFVNKKSKYVMRKWIDLMSESAETPAERMIDAFYDAKDDRVEVSLSEVSEREVEIVSILVRQHKGLGLGGKTMTLLTQMADQFSIDLSLSPAEDADGEDGGLDLYGLIDWYERYGFSGGRVMRRSPNQD